MIGIYKITNLINNKVYIGSSNNLTKRKIRHFYLLRNNKHHSIKLQRAWNKYGENKFVFEIIEKCNETDLLIKEKYWIDFFNSYNNGYNCNPTPFGTRGYKWSIESRKKLSNTNKGKTHSKETILKISLAHKGRVGNRKGKKASKETIKKMIFANSGNKKSDKILNKKPERNLKNPKSILCYDLNNNFIREYNNQAEIAFELNLSKGNICSVLKGKRHSCGGFIFKYK